jgi:hypothetical protein
MSKFVGVLSFVLNFRADIVDGKFLYSEWQMRQTCDELSIAISTEVWRR